MPMHDWTRVDDGIYHHFHGRWLYAIADGLNAGVLPAEYYALTHQIVRPFEPDVLALELRPPVPAGPGRVTATRTAHPPAVQTVLTARRRKARRAQRQVLVRHVTNHRLVAVIELVSPGNKGSVRDFTAFVFKAVELLDAGVNLLVIDPFPPTARDPNGVHAAVWRAAARRAYSPPADRPLTVVSYIGGTEITAYVQPFAAGQRVPDMPLFLDDDNYVTVPLEDTYQAALPTMPTALRGLLGP